MPPHLAPRDGLKYREDVYRFNANIIPVFETCTFTGLLSGVDSVPKKFPAETGVQKRALKEGNINLGVRRSRLSFF